MTAYVVQARTHREARWQTVARMKSLVHAFVFLRGYGRVGDARILDASGDTVALVSS